MPARLIAVVILSVCHTHQATADEVRLLGAGARATCGQWLADRQSGQDLSMANWGLGFLSASAAFSRELNPLNAVDSQAVLYWLDSYCRSQPLHKFTTALKAFIAVHPN